MNTIFWNVDSQKDFMNSNGALYVKDAETIKPKLKEITEFARKHKIKVVNTADCHTIKSKEISRDPDFKTTFPPHCMLLEEGIEFIEETYPKTKKDNYSMVCYTDKELHHAFNRARNIIIYKDDFDVFLGNPLTDHVLKRLAPERVVVYGVATNVCVAQAVAGLLERHVVVYVVTNAIKELPNLPVKELYDAWIKAGVIAATWEEVKAGICFLERIKDIK